MGQPKNQSGTAVVVAAWAAGISRTKPLRARPLLSHHAARGGILSCSFPQAAASAIFLVLGLFLLKDNVGTLQSITPAEVTLSQLKTSYVVAESITAIRRLADSRHRWCCGVICTTAGVCTRPAWPL